MMELQLEPADIFFMRGNGLLSRAVRSCTRTIGESRTKVNHVGMVVSKGTLHKAVVIEARSTLKCNTLWESYGSHKKDLVAVYRPVNLKPEEITKIVKEAEEQIGKKYAYFNVDAHLLDWLLLGVYFFRRFVNNGRYPIHSWLVAHAYSKVNINFGCGHEEAEPDDIWDFVHKNTDKFKEIYPLSLIWNNNRTGYRSVKAVVEKPSAIANLGLVKDLLQNSRQ